jgi:histidine triad (HIT) family protein
MTTAADCVFCRIVAGELPATLVAQTERTVAFRDLAPAAPVHVLVVPRAHHPDLAGLSASDPVLLAGLWADAVAVARSEGLDGGYRMVVNTGADGGQTVLHVHVHVLGGGRVTGLAG